MFLPTEMCATSTFNLISYLERLHHEFAPKWHLCDDIRTLLFLYPRMATRMTPTNASTTSYIIPISAPVLPAKATSAHPMADSSSLSPVHRPTAPSLTDAVTYPTRVVRRRQDRWNEIIEDKQRGKTSSTDGREEYRRVGAFWPGKVGAKGRFCSCCAKMWCACNLIQ